MDRREPLVQPDMAVCQDRTDRYAELFAATGALVDAPTRMCFCASFGSSLYASPINPQSGQIGPSGQRSDSNTSRAMSAVNSGAKRSASILEYGHSDGFTKVISPLSS